MYRSIRAVSSAGKSRENIKGIVPAIAGPVCWWVAHTAIRSRVTAGCFTRTAAATASLIASLTAITSAVTITTGPSASDPIASARAVIGASTRVASAGRD